LLLILHKKIQFISLCLKPEMWQKVAEFKGAEYFRKALYFIVLMSSLLFYNVENSTNKENPLNE
jgi:hypothetical protein